MRKTALKPKAERDAPVPPKELRDWRKALLLTQVEAADVLGVTLRSYENWEQGYRPMAHPRAMRTLMDQALARRRRKTG